MKKDELIRLLREVIQRTDTFCAEKGIGIENLLSTQGFERIKLLDDAVEAILIDEESKKKFLLLSGDINRLYKAILPDPSAGEFVPKRTLFVILGEKIRSLTPEADISKVKEAIEEVLDESIASEGYVINDPSEKYGVNHLVDLSKIDFDGLKAYFEKSRKRTLSEKLRSSVEQKLNHYVSNEQDTNGFL